MPQCHNSLWTAQYVATKCHINATMPQPSKPLKINDATNATNATTKKGVRMYARKCCPKNTKSPEEEHLLPQG